MGDAALTLQPRTAAAEPEPGRQTARWRETPAGQAIYRFGRTPAGLIALGVLVFFLAVAALAQWLAPYDPLAPSLGEALQPISARHWFGTDQFGRDVLSRVMYGARLSVPLGLIPVLIGAALGSLLGLIAGYAEGWPRRAVMRVVDVLLGFPLFLLALFIVAVLGPSLLNAMIAVGVSSTPTYARVIYGSVLSVKERDYILAARALGAGEARILLMHVIPNVIAPVIVVATVGMAYAILTGAALSFLGLGVQPPTPEWGLMVYEGRDYLRAYWWISTMPGLMIAVAVLAVNVLGDVLRDVLDPRAAG
jgi:peptide/nickel transport system permease protein